MDHSGDHIWLKDALVFLFAAGVVAPALRLLRIPSVLGFLLAGIALGPFGLGAWTENWHGLEYITISEPETAAPFAELGVLFLLFLLGLEMSIARLWALRKIVIGAGGIQALASATVLTFVLLWFSLPPPAAIAIGLALALSSTAIVMQVLIEDHRAARPIGRTALGVLLFQDMLVAPILILVGFLAQDSGASLTALLGEALVEGAIAVIVILLIGRFVLRRVFQIAARTGGRDFLMALTLLTVVGAAVITAFAGLSLALGAFLAGLLLGETEFKHQTEVDLEPFKGLLLGLFFMTVGMSLNLPAIWQAWPIVAGCLAGLLAIKGVIAVIACRLFAGDRGLSVEAAFLLAPAGEFAFVVITAAKAGGVVDAETAGIVSAIAGLSMILTPMFAVLGKQVGAALAPDNNANQDLTESSDASGHYVIAGFGRVGRRDRAHPLRRRHRVHRPGTAIRSWSPNTGVKAGTSMSAIHRAQKSSNAPAADMPTLSLSPSTNPANAEAMGSHSAGDAQRTCRSWPERGTQITRKNSHQPAQPS